MSTLFFVTGKKKLDRKHADHLAAILRPVVQERFEGNQTAFAAAAGISQSQASAILKAGGGDRSVGINVLIRIRDYLETMTIDEMLGLPPPRRRAVTPDVLEVAVLRALDRRFPSDELVPSRQPLETAKRKKPE